MASAIGVAIGVFVLFAAKGARRAAEEARDLARKKSLVEELEQASEKVQQMAIFARARQSEILHLRANEVIALCKVAVARWPDHLGTEAKNDLLTARAQVRSIAQLAFASKPLTDKEWKSVSAAQLEASDLISGALGRARKQEERSKGQND